MTSLTPSLFDDSPILSAESFSLSICSHASAYRGGCYSRHWPGHDQNPFRAGTPEHSAWDAGYSDAGDHAK